jgi:lysophospholipase L1-like esterase
MAAAALGCSPASPYSPDPFLRLSVTNFVAFGDSITAGEIPDNTDTSLGRIRPMVVHQDLAYPARLKQLLSDRFPNQTFIVSNAGCQGEPVQKLADQSTLQRFDAVMSGQGGVQTINGCPPPDPPITRVDAVILLEGVNDLSYYDEAGIAPAIAALRTMIRDARGRGAQVIIGTLLPEVAPNVRATTPDLIPLFNAQLVPMATAEGALVVDLYTPFLTNTNEWISPLDGLHPTAAGYQEMALLFFRSLETGFEVPLSVAHPVRRPQ